MGELKGDNILAETSGNVLRHRGDVVIGLVDPRGLSREEFRASPDLLFHGSGSPFEFRQDLNYESFVGPGSFTVGAGLYTTDNREEAELYSKIRQGKGKSDDVAVFVEEFLPYRAKMLDLRSVEDINKDANFPAELARMWLDFYKKDYETTYPPGYLPANQKEVNAYSVATDYRSHLFRLFRENPSPLMDLRALLKGDYSEENMAKVFSRFMKQLGYDGLIFNEGGDNPDAKTCASYVFYNLGKVGTYEIWHKQGEVKK